MDGLWATKSEYIGLIVRAISLQHFQRMWSWSTNVTDGRTDRRHAISIPRFAVHRAVKMARIRLCGNLLQAVSVLWNCLAYFNSCVNPIIYNRTSKEFRDAFLEVCGCHGRHDRSNFADMADGRRVNMVTHLSPDNRRNVSCATYFPSPPPGAVTSEHLTPRPPTTLQAPDGHKCYMLDVPTTQLN